MNEMMSNQRNGSDTLQRSVNPEVLTMQRSALQDPTNYDWTASHYGVDARWDYHGTSASKAHLDDGYGRYDVYHGLYIHSIDYMTILSSFFRCSHDEIPREIVRLFLEQGWGEEDAYSVDAVSGYYGEELEYTFPEGMVEGLTQAYWNLPNAADDDGVLEYVRSKGVDTTGLTPVQALQAQLAEEFVVGFLPYSAEEKTDVLSLELKFYDITLSAHQRFYTDSVAPDAANNESETIVGILVDTDNDELRLVDGARRLKYVRDLGRLSGKFLLLTNSEQFWRYRY